MGYRKEVKYQADVIDDVQSDWDTSDDGDDYGPIDQWPAPFLGSDDGSNSVPARELRLAGTRNGERFDGQAPFEAVPPHVIPLRSSFSDGGLNLVGSGDPIRDQGMANVRREDALFSRPSFRRNSSYGFLRRTDPGTDLSDAPRRGPRRVYASSVSMMGAGSLDAMMADAGDVYGDISTYHAQTFALLGRSGRKVSPQDAAHLQNLFANVQTQARTGNAWTAVQRAHEGSYQIWERTLGRKLTSAEAAELLAHFQRLSKVMPGSPSVLTKIGNVAESIGGAIASVPVLGTLAKATFTVATTPAQLAGKIATGSNVLESFKGAIKDNIQAAKDVAPYAQAVLTLVPGVGTGVSAALGAGLALASGQPITQALMAGVRSMVPGGPVAQAAFDTALNLASGKNIQESVLAAARERIPGGPAAKAAFDTAVALANGKNVQEAALSAGVSIVKDKAMAMISPLSPLAKAPLASVGPAIGKVTQQTVSILRPNVKMVAQAVLSNPSLRSLPAADLARKMNVPTGDAIEALASVVQAAQKTGNGQKAGLAPAPAIATRLGSSSTFDGSLARFGSNMAPIAFSPNRKPLPIIPSLMPGALNIQRTARGLFDAGYLTIKLNSTGPDVVAWQRIINVTADGKFGPQTDKATRAWQAARGLVPDGIVGPKTWDAATKTAPSTTVFGPPPPPASQQGVPTLPEVVISAAPPPPLSPTQVSAANAMPTIKLGSFGPAVMTWQGVLRRDSGISGFTAQTDGEFGPVTDKATRQWQKSSGLASDGIVGPQTWKKAIGSLTTPPLPAEVAPGVPLPTPPPAGLPPGLPPIPVAPVGAPPAPPVVSPPITVIGPVGPGTAVPKTPVRRSPPKPPAPPSQPEKSGQAIAAIAVGALAAKVFGLF